MKRHASGPYAYRSAPTLADVYLIPGIESVRRIKVCLDDQVGITASRLWGIMKRHFATAAPVFEDHRPTGAEKLRRATPHWMRRTHATHALDGGTALAAACDNPPMRRTPS